MFVCPAIPAFPCCFRHQTLGTQDLLEGHLLPGGTVIGACSAPQRFENLQGGKKEWKTGAVEEREERSKEVKCVVEAKGNVAFSGPVGAGGHVAEFSHEWPGSLVDSEGLETAAERAENPHFANLESCGVPARLKTSELSAHQMPEILHAERSSSTTPSCQSLGRH